MQNTLDIIELRVIQVSILDTLFMRENESRMSFCTYGFFVFVNDSENVVDECPEYWQWHKSGESNKKCGRLASSHNLRSHRPAIFNPMLGVLLWLEKKRRLKPLEQQFLLL